MSYLYDPLTNKKVDDLKNIAITNVTITNNNGTYSIKKTVNGKESNVGSIDTNKSTLNAEIERAKSAENTISQNLSSEIKRAQDAESTLTQNLSSEVSRAKSAESTLTQNLSSEVSRAKSAESTLTQNLSSEVSRAKSAEQNLQTKITTDQVKPFLYTKNSSITNPELGGVITFNINLPNSKKTDEIVFFTNVSCNNNYIPVISQTYTHDSTSGNINIVVTAKINYIPSDTSKAASYNCVVQGFITNTK